MWTPKVCGHVGVQNPYDHWGTPDLSGMHCHLGQCDIQFRLLQKTTYGFVVILWFGSVPKSKSSLATKGCIEALSCGHSLRPYWCLGNMLPPEPSQSEYSSLLLAAKISFRPKLLLRARPGLKVQLQLGSVCMSVAHVISRNDSNCI